MTAEVFIDTNIFLYSLSDNFEERLKAERARQILMGENWGWSVQVAGEFYNVATSQKRQFRISHHLASEFIESWLNFRLLHSMHLRFERHCSWQNDFGLAIGTPR